MLNIWTERLINYNTGMRALTQSTIKHIISQKVSCEESRSCAVRTRSIISRASGSSSWNCNVRAKSDDVVVEKHNFEREREARMEKRNDNDKEAGCF
jgi:hypothetical protein